MTPKRSSARLSPRAIARSRPRRGRPHPLQHLLHPRQSRTEGLPPAERLQEAAGKAKSFGVLGCVAQQEGEKIFERAPYVSLVVRIGFLPQSAGDAGAARGRESASPVSTTARPTRPSRPSSPRARNPHRGYITIIEGCDKFCAYCVVPYTRGKERSRTSDSVLAKPANGRWALPTSSCSGRT
jgi:tRNA A37 methylthiotransferase MiaB